MKDCVILQPNPLEMVLCGITDKEHTICELGRAKWLSVWVERQELLGWHRASVFGHTLCSEGHQKCWGTLPELVTFLRENKRTYAPGYTYRIVNRLGKVLWEGPVYASSCQHRSA